MKNYLIDPNELFILNYQIKEGQMFVNCISNGRKRTYTVPYTSENEQDLFEKLKFQDFDEYVRKQKNKVAKSSEILKKYSIIALIILVVGIILFISLPISFSFVYFLMAALIVEGLGALGLYRKYEDYIGIKSLIDIKKNKKFNIE